MSFLPYHNPLHKHIYKHIYILFSKTPRIHTPQQPTLTHHPAPQTIATEALTLLNARARGVEQISSSENQAPKKDEHLKKISSSKVPEEERAKALVLRSMPLPGNWGVGNGEMGEEEREEKEGEADEEHEPCFGGVVASEEEKEKEDEEEGALSSDGQLPASVATDWNRGDFALALRFRRRSFEQRM